jgi:hypothetical protein
MQATTTATDLRLIGLQDQLDQAWLDFFALNGADWDIQGPAARRVLDLQNDIRTLGGEPR